MRCTLASPTNTRAATTMPRMGGLKFVAELGYASKCVLGFAVTLVVERFKRPRSMLGMV